jgi:hypothetical protein
MTDRWFSLMMGTIDKKEPKVNIFGRFWEWKKYHKLTALRRNPLQEILGDCFVGAF